MVTYKDKIKDETRFLVWDHAVESLTAKREYSRILDKSYVNNLWHYCFQDNIIKYGFAQSYKEKYLQDWLSFSDISYSTKTPQELKVAFFCGPEPENDVNHLIRLGVRIENIYAFEGNSKLFAEAIKSLNKTYPTLKIFNGQIQDFVKANFITFDIIYLDFTKSLLDNSTFQVFCDIVDSNSLSNLGIIAINTCYPEKNQENLDFLTDYFYYQEFIEWPVLKDKDKDEDEEEENSGRFIESCECYGYDRDYTRILIERNFENAYSAFQTNIIINYTNHIKPFWCSLNKRFIRERLLNISPEKLEKFGCFPEFQDGEFGSIDDIFEKFFSNYDSSIYLEPSSYSLFHFIDNIKTSNNSWRNFFAQKGVGSYNRKQAVIAFYCFLDSVSQSGIEYLSDTFKKEISNIHNNLIGAREGLFCDVPMIHLWLELAIYQLGYPYHQNTKNHKRYSYIAKTNKMCLDIFTFDQCRALYDWLPMVEYYGSDLRVLERQIMARICMDSIKKHNLHILSKLYFGAALIGWGERDWADIHYFMDRKYINT